MAGQVFIQFLILGCLAFGGPIAHLAWFERFFVDRLRWLTHEELAGLIALCQALPGPASSQTAIGIGYLRAGWKGFWLAWLGFTIPPAILMISAGYGALLLPESYRSSLTYGMKVAVVGVIAVALWRMAGSLIKSRTQVGFAAGYTLLFLFFGSPAIILLSILLVALISIKNEGLSLSGSLAGLMKDKLSKRLLMSIPAILIVFKVATILIPGPWTAITEAFYQTGLLVFGGGHVVLPMLESMVVGPGWVAPDAFLFGYGVAQMIPGPLFTFAAFLGTQFPLADSSRYLGGILALVAIYLPSFILLAMLLPHWKEKGPSKQWKAVLTNLHPLVIGLLLATWMNPVIADAILRPVDVVVVVAATVLLYRYARFTVLILLAIAGLYLAIPMS